MSRDPNIPCCEHCFIEANGCVDRQLGGHTSGCYELDCPAWRDDA